MTRMNLSVKLESSPVEWAAAEKDIAWCWKRDDGLNQRVIYFDGRLERNRTKRVVLCDPTFFYKHRCKVGEAELLYEQLTSLADPLFERPTLERRDTHAVLTIRTKHASDASTAVLYRLFRRRPRARIPVGRFPAHVPAITPRLELGPTFLYAGSGLSYEAKLPTLLDVHVTFGVEAPGEDRFLFGAEDPIPRRLTEGVTDLFREFSRLHIAAARAQPSASHRRIGELYRAGIIRHVFTDNIDNLFSKIGVPFTRVRTIFPERRTFSAPRDCSTLLVVGVAADRRSIIQTMRPAVLRVIVVNPQHAVAPRAQNLSYLRPDDTWYRATAHQFFHGCL